MKLKKFNNIRIPISFLLVFVFLQLLFFLLKDIPLSRHPLDELIYNLNFSKENGRIVLLGDSITYDVAKRYQIGKKNMTIMIIQMIIIFGHTCILFLLDLIWKKY